MIYEANFKMLSGKNKGQTYTIKKDGTYLAGRDYSEQTAPILLSSDNPNHTNRISRLQFVIEAKFPNIFIRDAGSLNGTYINSTSNLIGSRPQNMSAEEVANLKEQSKFKKLNNGDKIIVGRNLCSLEYFLVEKHICQYCGREISLGSKRKEICNDCYNNIINLKQEVFSKVDFLKRYQMNIHPFKAGGMGEVYKAFDKIRNKHVIIKLIKPQDNEYVQEICSKLFVREANMSVQLDHPNIVKNYDIGILDKFPFISMEYCPYGNLLEYQMNNMIKDLHTAVDITIQILSALDYAHNKYITTTSSDGSIHSYKGLIHRDLKPQNILIFDGRRPEIKICDFGLAKPYESAGFSGSLTKSGEVRGTYHFMCRQQLTNYKYSKPDVDIWATMSILYFMLTGTVPRDFENYPKTDPAVIVLSKKCIPIENRYQIIKCPKKLANIINRALDDSDSLYYQSAINLAKDLEEFL